MRDHELRERLVELDPARDTSSDHMLPPEELLAAILASPHDEPHRRRRGGHRRMTVALAATVALVGALFLLQTSDETRDGRAIDVLRSAAAVADAQAAAPSARVRYSETESATLHTIGDDPPFSVLIPRRSEVWAEPDDSGRVVTEEQSRVFPGPRDRARWIAHGRPPVLADRRGSKQVVGSGGLAGPADAGLPATRTLPTRPDALRDRLETVARETDVPVPVKTFELAAAILAQANPPDELRAALYRVLTQLDGVTYDGRARDPRGRRGVAVSIDSHYTGAPTRHVLYFDPETSRPLAATSELERPVQWTDGPTVAYTIVLREGNVETVGARPR